MSSPDDEWDDGVAVERTALAWERSGLSMIVVAAIALATAADRGQAWAVVIAWSLAICGVAAWAYGRFSYRTRQPIALVKPDPRALRLLTLETLAAGGLALAMMLLPPG
jgi:uncharacterized membrane protein YidH (DUF202 family)